MKINYVFKFYNDEVMLEINVINVKDDKFKSLLESIFNVPAHILPFFLKCLLNRIPYFTDYTGIEFESYIENSVRIYNNFYAEEILMDELKFRNILVQIAKYSQEYIFKSTDLRDINHKYNKFINYKTEIYIQKEDSEIRNVLNWLNRDWKNAMAEVVNYVADDSYEL